MVGSPRSYFRIDKVYQSQAFQRAWENKVAFHVAANILQLRKFRRWSQSRLARAAKTSQSAIARIEGEDGNITLSTLERLLGVLNGRLRLETPPEELAKPKSPSWWTTHEDVTPGWTIHAVLIQDNGEIGKKAAVLLTQEPSISGEAELDQDLIGGDMSLQILLSDGQEAENLA